MSKYLLVPQTIITADANDSIFHNKCLEIENGVITGIHENSTSVISGFQGEVVHLDNKVLIPGFVQTHIHLCQTLFRGLADDMELLDWLQKRIFPCENSHDPASLKSAAQLGIYELTMGGTTCLLDMGTMRHQETIFDELIGSGMRAVAGKCMIDQNDLYPSFKSTTKAELDYTYELANAYHNIAEGRIRYGFAPRFVLSCTEELLKETRAMMDDFTDSIYHTHSSENKGEIQEVRRLHNRENIDYFNSINVLGDHTVLAHCIHVNDHEVDLLRSTRTRVAHCPSSNMKLASGIAPIHRYLQEGVHVSLGADGAPCNNTLSAFNEMRLAALLQKPFHGPTVMDAKTVFRLATIEGAKALHVDSLVGSIEIGKKADLCILDLSDPTFSVSPDDEALYSNIVYAATAARVTDVMINGAWVVRKGEHQIYEKDKVYSTAKAELKNVLQRVQNS
ncbi:MAG: amidohydrolase family protein [Ignavibacteria bacterium]|nr:amidohydrolase family protein [Ignavibacteria bacterium]